MPEHVREGGEQLAVLELHSVLGQDGRVLELVRYLGERREILVAVDGRACGSARDVVGGHALGGWWAQGVGTDSRSCSRP